MRYFVTIDGQEHEVEVTRRPDGTYSAELVAPAGATYSANIAPSSEGRLMTIGVDERQLTVLLDGKSPDQELYVSGQRARVTVESARSRELGGAEAGRAGSGTVSSPMPGRVVRVLVREGQSIEAGAPVVVVEAMKMENQIGAPATGVVQKVLVAAGDAVERGATLAIIGEPA